MKVLLILPVSALLLGLLCTFQLPPLSKEPPQDLFMWAFGRVPSSGDSLEVLIEDWNRKHGHKLKVKPTDDPIKVWGEICELWEKEKNG